MSNVRTRRAGGERRITALDAAIDVLAQRGTEHTRFADVADESGIAVSTLQYYFGSREDMLVEALHRAIDLEMEAVEAAAAAQTHPWRRLEALVTRTLRNSIRDRLIMLEFWRATLRDDELQQYCLDLEERCRAPFLRAIADGQEQGIFHPGYPPEEVAQVLIATLCGLSHPWVAQQDRPADGFRSVLLIGLRATLGFTPDADPDPDSDSAVATGTTAELIAR